MESKRNARIFTGKPAKLCLKKKYLMRPPDSANGLLLRNAIKNYQTIPNLVAVILKLSVKLSLRLNAIPQRSSRLQGMSHWMSPFVTKFPEKFVHLITAEW